MTKIVRVGLALSPLLLAFAILSFNYLPGIQRGAAVVVAKTHQLLGGAGAGGHNSAQSRAPGPGAATLQTGVADVKAVSVSKTTTSLAGALSGAMSMTGTITLAGEGGKTYTVVDAFQALPSGGFYQGTYTISFTCSPGIGSSTAETIGEGGSLGGSTSSPPDDSGAPTITTDQSGNATCTYTSSFSGTAPDGNIASVRNAIWIGCEATGCLTSGASVSISPAAAIVPEAPFAVLLPITGFALLGLFVFVVARRRNKTSETSQ